MSVALAVLRRVVVDVCMSFLSVVLRDHRWLEHLLVLDMMLSYIAAPTMPGEEDGTKCTELIVNTCGMFRRLAEEDWREGCRVLLALVKLEWRAWQHNFPSGSLTTDASALIVFL